MPVSAVGVRVRGASLQLNDSKAFEGERQTQSLVADGELIEYICNENHEANLPHVKGKP